MGLLTDFLGAMAQTGGSMLEQDRKQKEEEAKEARLLERQKAMTDYTAEVNMKKQELLQQLAEDRKLREQKKYVDDMATAEGAADGIGYQRRFDKFKKLVGQTDATDDELKEGFKAYDDKRIMVDGKVDKQFADRSTDKADDMVTAARKTGNMGLIESTLKSRQEARATQSAADKAEYDERRLEQKDKSEKEERDRREKADDRKYDLMEQRIAKSGSGGSSDRPERLDELDKAELEMAKKRVIDAEKDFSDAKTSRAKAEAEKRRDEARADFKNLTEKLRSQKPAPSSGGTVGGNAPPKTSGRGDPPPGSGNVTESNVTPGRVAELQAQFDEILKQHTANPSRQTEEILQSLESQLNLAKKIAAAKSGGGGGRGLLSSGDVNTKENGISTGNGKTQFQVTGVRRVEDKPAKKPDEPRKIAYDPLDLMNFLSKGHGPAITYRADDNAPSIYRNM
jgi:hypothetical protein